MSTTLEDQRAAHAPPSPSIGMRVARHLVATDKVKPADIDRARQLADENLQSLGLTLTRTGLVSDRDLAAAYAQVLDRPLVADGEFPAEPLPELEHKESFLRDSKIVPLSSGERTLAIATADPENAFALDVLAMATGARVSFSIATVAQIDRALDSWFGNDSAGTPEVLDDAAEPSADDLDAVDRLRDLASEAPIVRLVNLIVQRAVERRASDIHVEPFNGELRIRYRIDGVLQPVEAPPARSAAAVVSRIKLMAKMNIAERRLPQDGRVHLRVQGTVVDLRVSTVPTVEGESVVLRILDQENVNLDLDTLGFGQAPSEAIQRSIELPHGIVLVTGPTGSGKTTTLYAVLQRLNSSERKIVTIEDPVEYQLEGVNQIQVKPQIGLDFAQALRSIVRQDPDIILVGEMRDLETARIAVQSALTGHLVFSTLHTNDAGSSVTRLLDMGVEDYLVTSSVNAIVAQRLVRRLCLACRAPYQPPDALVERLNLHGLQAQRPIRLYAAAGCDACQRTGYLGRTVIAEILVVSDAIRRAILSRADGRTIERVGVGEGMETMKTDGLRKALAGDTSVEEVTRVAHS